MYAINIDGIIRTGGSFPEAITNKAIWIVTAAGKRFEVTQAVSGDDACSIVRNILTENRVKFSSIQFQRSI